LRRGGVTDTEETASMSPSLRGILSLACVAVLAVAARAVPPPKNAPRLDAHGDPLPPGAIARLGTLRFRAPVEVNALAFAPDGKTIAVSSGNCLFLFDTASGKRTRRVLGADCRWDLVSPPVFSPDGRRLARRGRTTDGRRVKGAVRVWELASEKLRDYDADKAVWVGWSAGGDPLAVCLEAGALRLRELAAGRARRFECSDLKKPELSDYVVCTYTPDGQALAVADEQGTVHVWDSATGRERCTVKPRGDSILGLAFSSDGRTLASLNREVAKLWDARTGKLLHTVGVGQKYIATVAFTPDSKVLATVGAFDVRFWDVTTGRERGRAQAEGRTFAPSVAFSPDGKVLASPERDTGTIQLWDVATGRLKPQPVGHRAEPWGTFSPDGRRVMTAGGVDGSIHVWDVETGEPLTFIQRPSWVRGIAFSPDGQLLYSTGLDESLWISDTATGKRRIIKLEDPDRPDTYQWGGAMRLSADGKTLVVFSSYHRKENAGGPQYEETLIT